MILKLFRIFRQPVSRCFAQNACIFQILIIAISLSHNMQINVLGGGVGTVCDHHLQGPGFDSRRYLIRIYLFQITIQQDMIYMTSL